MADNSRSDPTKNAADKGQSKQDRKHSVSATGHGPQAGHGRSDDDGPREGHGMSDDRAQAGQGLSNDGASGSTSVKDSKRSDNFKHSSGHEQLQKPLIHPAKLPPPQVMADNSCSDPTKNAADKGQSKQDRKHSMSATGHGRSDDGPQVGHGRSDDDRPRDGHGVSDDRPQVGQGLPNDGASGSTSVKDSKRSDNFGHSSGHEQLQKPLIQPAKLQLQQVMADNSCSDPTKNAADKGQSKQDRKHSVSATGHGPQAGHGRSDDDGPREGHGMSDDRAQAGQGLSNDGALGSTSVKDSKRSDNFGHSSGPEQLRKPLIQPAKLQLQQVMADNNRPDPIKNTADKQSKQDREHSVSATGHGQSVDGPRARHGRSDDDGHREGHGMSDDRPRAGEGLSDKKAQAGHDLSNNRPQAGHGLPNNRPQAGQGLPNDGALGSTSVKDSKRSDNFEEQQFYNNLACPGYAPTVNNSKEYNMKGDVQSQKITGSQNISGQNISTGSQQTMAIAKQGSHDSDTFQNGSTSSPQTVVTNSDPTLLTGEMHPEYGKGSKKTDNGQHPDVTDDVSQGCKQDNKRYEKTIEVKTLSYNLLKKEKSEEFLQGQVLKEFRTGVEWFLKPRSNVVLVRGNKEGDVHAAVDLIKKSVIEEEICSNQVFSAYTKSKSWKDFSMKYHGRFLITDGTDDEMICMAYMSDIQEVCRTEISKIKNTILHNNKFMEKIPVSVEKFKIFSSLKEAFCQDLEKKHNVKITLRKEENIIVIEGGNCSLAAVSLQVELEKIDYKTLSTSDIGPTYYIQLKEGQDELQKIAKSHGCNITSDKRLLNIEPCHVIDLASKNRFVCVMHGNIARLKADVLVCPVNTSLIGIDVGYDIIKQGGETLMQSIGEMSMKEEGKHQLGSVIPNDKTSNLSCQTIFYTIIVEELYGHKKYMEDTKTIFTKILDTASKLDACSIAIPYQFVGKTIMKAQSEILAAWSSSFLKYSSAVTELYICSNDMRHCRDLRDLLKRQECRSPEVHAFDFESVPGFLTSEPDFRQESRPSASFIKIEIQKGSLETENVDVIVNTVSTDINLSKGNVSKKIMEASGIDLQRECIKQFPKGIPIGRIASTKAGILRCTNILHVVLLPKWIAKADISLRVLKLVVWQCLQHAHENNFSSIAFPGLGTGKLSYPPRQVAKTILQCVKEFEHQKQVSSLTLVKIVMFDGDKEVYQIFKNSYKQLDMKAHTESHEGKFVECRIQGKSGDVHIQAISNKDIIHQEYEATANLLSKLKTTSGYKKKTDNNGNFIISSFIDEEDDDVEGFKNAVQKVLTGVNEEKITSIRINLCDCKFDTKRQLELIKETVEECESLKYLRRVQVCVPEKDLFDILSQEQQKDGFFKTVLKKIQGKASKAPWKALKFTQTSQQISELYIHIEGEKESVTQACQSVSQLINRENSKYWCQEEDRRSSISSNTNSFDDQRKGSVPEIISCIKATWNPGLLSKRGEHEELDKMLMSEQNSTDGTEIIASDYSEFQIKVKRAKDFVEKINSATSSLKTYSTSSKQGIIYQQGNEKDDGDYTHINHIPDISEIEYKMCQNLGIQKGWWKKGEDCMIWNSENKAIMLETPDMKDKIENFVKASRAMTKEEYVLEGKEEITEEDLTSIQNMSHSSADISPSDMLVYFDKVRTIHIWCKDYEVVQIAKHKIGVKTGKIKTKTRRHRQFGNDSQHTTPAPDEQPPVNESGRNLSQSVRTSPQWSLLSSGDFKTAEGLVVKVYTGNILRLDVDCIVNAANERLMHGGGVAAVISEHAGYNLDRESREYISTYGELKVGESCTTTAGNLPYKYVVHTVGPRWSDRRREQCIEELKTAVAGAIECADKCRMKSIGIPSISAGIFGMPKDLCAQQYVEGLKYFISHQWDPNTSSIEEVHFIDKDEGLVNAIKHAFTTYLDIPSRSKSSSYRSQRSFTDIVSAESVEIKDLTPENMKDKSEFQVTQKLKVYVQTGNIVEIKVEAITCPQDTKCEGKGCIAKEIYKHGSDIYKKDNTWGQPLRQGEVGVKCSEEPWRYVLHIVAPKQQRSTRSSDEKLTEELTECCLNLMKKSEDHKASSLSIPVLGIGEDGAVAVAEIFANAAVSAINTFIKNSPKYLEKIYFVCNKEDAVQKMCQNFMKTWGNNSVSSRSDLESTVKKDKNVEMVSATPLKHQTPEEVDCCICMDKCTEPKRLRCGHVFCTDCIDQCFKYKPSCPQCGAVYGKMYGDQPPGTITIKRWHYTHLSGYEGCGSIEIDYNIPTGKQSENHPKPGQIYEGIRRSGHLPYTEKGRLVCKLLNVAFSRKLVFTIGRSRTTGKEGVVTWNDIHHKTRKEGGPQRFGYPDPTYLDRVTEELEVKGVTADSADDPEEYREYSAAFRY